MRAMPELCQAALEHAGGDPLLEAYIHEALAWDLSLQRDELERAARHARTAVGLAEHLEDPALLRDALSAQGQSEFLLGAGLPSAPMERALEMTWEGSEEVSAMGLPEMHWSLMLQCADRLSEARSNYERLDAHAVAQGDESAIPWILMRLSHVELFAGDWGRAVEHADRGHEKAIQAANYTMKSALSCTRALLAAHLGQAEASSLAEEGLRQAESRGDGIGARLGRWALGLVALSLGDMQEAERVLGRLWSDSITAGIVEPGENRYAGDLAEALVALGRLDEAADVADELERRGAELRRPAVLAVAARCRGLVAGGSGDLDRALEELSAAVALHSEVTLPFQRARTLQALGSVQRRAKRLTEARRSLEEARERFSGLGARPWGEQVERELKRIGGRAPSPDELTPAEERVAELVAEGRTNREVAAVLVVAVRTVESHLSHIYRKLGVRSRTELARRYDRVS